MTFAIRSPHQSIFDPMAHQTYSRTGLIDSFIWSTGFGLEDPDEHRSHFPNRATLTHPESMLSPSHFFESLQYLRIRAIL